MAIAHTALYHGRCHSHLAFEHFWHFLAFEDLSIWHRNSIHKTYNIRWNKGFCTRVVGTSEGIAKLAACQTVRSTTKQTGKMDRKQPQGRWPEQQPRAQARTMENNPFAPSRIFPCTLLPLPRSTVNLHASVAHFNNRCWIWSLTTTQEEKNPKPSMCSI